MTKRSSSKSWLCSTLLCLTMAGCTFPSPPVITTSPLSSPLSPVSTLPPDTPVRSDVVRFFTDTLISPGGQVSLALQCSQCCADIPHCIAVLPNGVTIYEADKSCWSPDERFAVICMNSFHDTPCGWYEVWDMVDGIKKATFYSYFHRWSPTETHLLVYLVQTSYISTRDQLVMLDPLSGEVTDLKACPQWFYQEFPEACESFPGAVVGGQIYGLPADAVVEIVAYGPDGTHYRLSEQRANFYWAGRIKMSFGTSYTVTARANQYSSYPGSYTIRLSDVDEHVVVEGYYPDLRKGEHLDFYFSISAQP